MIRSLKILIAAAFALGAFGVLGSSGAQAASFHCSTKAFCSVTVKADGTGKAAHHVWVIKQGAKSMSITCESMSGSGATFETESEFTIGSISYFNCTLGGSLGATVVAGGCHYRLTATAAPNFDIICSGGQTVNFTLKGCEVKIGSQGALSSAQYTNINSKKEVTVGLGIKNLKASIKGCAEFGLSDGESSESEYSTGNIILFAHGASFWYE